MAETHVIEYELTEEMADAAAEAIIVTVVRDRMAAQLRPLFRKVGVYGLIAVGVLLIGVQLGQPWWFFIAPIAMIALVAIAGGIAVAYSFGRRLSRRPLVEAIRKDIRTLATRHVRWTVTEDTLSIQSGKDAAVIRWADVAELSLTGSFWLLTPTSGPPRLLSGDRIPEGTARFILKCAQQAGTHIRVADSGTGRAGRAGQGDFQ